MDDPANRPAGKADEGAPAAPAATARQGSQAKPSDGQGFKGQLTVFDMVIYGLIFMVPIATFSLFGGVSNASGGMPALAYVVAFVAMFFTVLSFGMMIRTFPSSGSIYTYATKSLGKGVGFVAGWLMLLQYLITPDMVFTMAAEALHTYVPAMPVWGWCLVLIALVFLVASRGIQTTMVVNRIALAFECVVLAMFLAFGVAYVVGHPDTSGFTAKAFFDPATFSVPSIMNAASLAVFSFVGFGCVATLTEEARDQRRGPERAMLVMVVILVVLFAATCYVATCIDPSGEICRENESGGFYLIAEMVGGKWFGELCAVAVALAQGVFTGLVGMVSVSRILCVMGKSGSLPSPLAKISPKTGVPFVATCFVAAFSLAILPFVIAIGMEGLAKVVNFGALSTYFLLNLCVIAWFWVRKKDRSNPLRMLVFPVAGALVVVAVLVSLDASAKVIGAAWIALGIVYYVVMRRVLHREITLQ